MTEVRKSIAAYLLAAVLSLVALVCVLQLWRADLSMPLIYGGDALLVQLWVKSLFENGWYLTNGSVGAPFGLEMHDFPSADCAFFLILRMMSPFFNDHVQLVNFYYFFTFPLSAVSALFVFRRFGASRGPAVLGGTLFACLPYHFLRGQEHLFLASYFLVPLSVLIALRLYLDGVALFGRDHNEDHVCVRPRAQEALTGLVLCALIGSGGVYYAFFTCYLLLVVGAMASFRRRRAYPLVSAGVAVALISIAVLANVSPKFLSSVLNGPNPESVVRSLAHVEVFGLKLVQMVLPVSGHRMPWLAHLKAHYDASFAQLVNENSSSTLGLVGASGFLALMAGIFLRRPHEDETPQLWNGLVDLNLAAVLLATFGGFGALFGFLVSQWIRAYNRMSIFIAFLSLFAAVLALTRLERHASGRNARWIVRAGLGVLLVVGVLDQTSSSFVPKYDELLQEFRRDAEFVGRIESTLPHGGMVFQLPYSRFPEPVNVHHMSWYDHLRGYFHSRTLRWSYGTMRGRYGDLWQSLAAGERPYEMANRLAFSGFGGIYIDRAGYVDAAVGLETELTLRLGVQPLVSQDGRFSFFGLERYAESLRDGLSDADLAARRGAALLPVLVAWGKGFYDREVSENGPFRWTDGSGEISVMNPSKHPRRVDLAMTLSTVTPEGSWVRLKGPGASTRFRVDGSGQRVHQTLVVPPGTSRLKLVGNGPRVTPAGDSRSLVFRVEGFAISDVGTIAEPLNGASVRR